MISNMSSDPPSDVANVRASERQVAFRHPIETTQKTGNTPPDRLSPLAAAIELSSQHIQTLHYGLTTFLMTLTEQCLRAYSVYHHSSAKVKEMSLNTTHVPNSIKKIRLTLQPLEEVKASEDFIALQARLVTETEALHRKWATEYSIIVDTWNCDTLLRRCQGHICFLLSQAARGFIAQFGLRNYTEHEAVMDFLALYSSAVLRTPLPLDVPTFLRVYKETNKLRLLPKPTLADQAILNTMIDQANRVIFSNTTTLPTNVSLHETSSLPSSLTGTSKSTPSPSGPPANSTTHPHPPLTQRPLITPGTITPSVLTYNNNNAPPTTTPIVLPTTTLGPTTPQATPRFTPPPPSTSRWGRQREMPTVTTATSPTPTIINPYQQLTNLQQLPRPFVTAQTLLPPPISPTPTAPEGTTSPFLSLTQDADNLDAEMAELCLAAFTTSAERRKIVDHLATLYSNTITLPITAFHNIITQREELLRIKNVTTPSLLNSNASKVVETLLKERPAERPVLAGLIREETEKSTSGLKRQLKSALDQLEVTQKTLQTLKHAERYPKNKRGSNMIWSRSPPVEDGGSLVAAATSPTYHLSPTPPPPRHTTLLERVSNTFPQPAPRPPAPTTTLDSNDNAATLPMRVRFVPATKQPSNVHPTNNPRHSRTTTVSTNSLNPADNPFRTVVDNAIAARRRQLNKRRQLTKYSKRNDTSRRK